MSDRSSLNQPAEKTYQFLVTVTAKHRITPSDVAFALSGEEGHQHLRPGDEYIHVRAIEADDMVLRHSSLVQLPNTGASPLRVPPFDHPNDAKPGGYE